MIADDRGEPGDGDDGRDEPDEGDEPEEGDEPDDGDARGDHDELVYDLGDWLPEERAQLALLLDREGVAHGWEDTDLVVAELDEDRVETLLDQVDRTGGVLVEAPTAVTTRRNTRPCPTCSARPTGWRETPKTGTSAATSSRPLARSTSGRRRSACPTSSGGRSEAGPSPSRNRSRRVPTRRWWPVSAASLSELLRGFL